MTALAADPTIRRQVMAAAHEILALDPDAAIDQITRAAGVSRATFYRHFGSRAELLASVAHEARPDARTRILGAAQDMLVRTSLAELSMDDLARAAGVSRGTLYRLYPGKAAVLAGLIERYSPFEEVRAILHDHADEAPGIVFPLIARAVVGVAGERLGLMRAVFHEATLGSGIAIAGAQPIFAAVLGDLVPYVQRQIVAGRMRPMNPLLAIQVFIGPIFFHLMTRPIVDQVIGLPDDTAASVEALVAASLAGLGAS